MARTNGFFGSLQGPFQANEQLFTKIQQDCEYTIQYITKLGIHCVKDRDLLALNFSREEDKIFVSIDGTVFQIGKTGMLQLQDVEVTSIQFLQQTDEAVYIDYQYRRLNYPEQTQD